MIRARDLSGSSMRNTDVLGLPEHGVMISFRSSSSTSSAVHAQNGVRDGALIGASQSPCHSSFHLLINSAFRHERNNFDVVQIATFGAWPGSGILYRKDIAIGGPCALAKVEDKTKNSLTSSVKRTSETRGSNTSSFDRVCVTPPTKGW